MTSFGSVRKWRESKNLTREQLADLCHVSYATIANWELGRNIPCGAAGAILESLMQGEIAVLPLTPQEEMLLDEAVKRGGFAGRLEFLSTALVEILNGAGKQKGAGAVKMPRSAKEPLGGAKSAKIKK